MKHPITPFPWHIGGTFKPDGDDPRTSIWGSPAPGMQSGNRVANDVRPADARLIINALQRLQMIADAAKDGASLTWIRAVAEEGLRGEPLSRLPVAPESAPSQETQIRTAAEALIEEIQQFIPVSTYCTAVIPMRLVMALRNALEGYVDG